MHKHDPVWLDQTGVCRECGKIIAQPQDDGWLTIKHGSTSTVYEYAKTLPPGAVVIPASVLPHRR